ncbi:kinase ['Osedax' symbiont bacterium Rs2_46_30_T18]|nr:kinase ['Osedax' symbiont bacterium Rs2_46_30_T18]
MTKREQQIINAIKSNPLISQSQLAEIIGISRSAIASHITNLISKGIIEGRGYVVAPKKFCVAIGGANMDILGKPDTCISANSSTPGSVTSSPGGVARNIAENIARLGDKCYLIAAVGDDSRGRQLVELSNSAGVDTSQVLSIAGQSTSCYLSILDSDAEMQLAIADMKILEQLTPERLQKQLPLLKQASLIVLDTNISVQLMQFLFSNLTATTFFVDTVSVAKAEKITPFLQSVHSLKPNLLEAEKISGMKISHPQQLPELADWFHSRGVQCIYISLGEQGLFYSNGQQQKLVKLPALQITNSNGAGDAMMAALCHCQLLDIEIEKSAYFALAAANYALATKATINTELSVAMIEKSLNQANLISSDS